MMILTSCFSDLYSVFASEDFVNPARETLGGTSFASSKESSFAGSHLSL